MEYILQTNALTKKYGRYRVLNGLTMNVPKGSIYGFVGRNGAGKTTLIRVLTALHHPTSGEYTIFGIKNSDPSLMKNRSRMGAIVETPSIYMDMTAKANLLHQCRLLKKSPDNIDSLLQLVGLGDTGKKVAKNFSLGMRQRLGIAMALIGDPEFLILDEPINGLDPQGIIEVRELITKLNQERGITILISSHILDELSKLATHYGFIEQGVIVKEMSADELHNSCRKAVKVETEDTALLSKVLTDMGYAYQVLSHTEALIFTPFCVTPFIKNLDSKGVTIISMTQQEESLENYFLKLIGGNANA